MKAVAIFLTLFLATLVRGEAPSRAVGVYIGSSGIEDRIVTLLANGNYLARWDSDIGSNGSASGTWELVGNEVRLNPKKEEGIVMQGYFRVLLLRQFHGRQALLRQEDKEFSDNPLFHLFLETKESNQTPKPAQGAVH